MDIETAPGLHFRARNAGTDGGREVLLLHGFAQTSRCWAAQLGALAAAGYRAVAFDHRGYSPDARPKRVEAYKPAELVADVLAVAGALGFDEFDLVGHDFGGMVAWMVAGHHPDRIRTLTVASTPHPAAFRSSYRDAEGDQNKRSSYMRSFREAERGSVGHWIPELAADAFTKLLLHTSPTTGSRRAGSRMMFYNADGFLRRERGAV
ncbi:MAG: hypothetical protein QOG69_2658 [Actinomycetota bacterium]|nr:hypothetical protein [Actinomycetota bacterium]